MFEGGARCAAPDELRQLAAAALKHGVRATVRSGATRGIFWNQKGWVHIAAPLQRQGETIAGAAVAISLAEVYTALRRTQHILLIYILVNALLLTVFGLYRLNHLAIKPIQRLVRRAEENREVEDGFFILDEEDNEFSRLSKSLNRMLMRISQDKDKLQSTILSLEQANRDLAQAQRELVRAEKLASVGRLSAGIAHEIGNPLGIIKGYLELLKAADLGVEEKSEFIARTEDEVERVNSIIRQMLDLARPSGEELTQVNVHAIIQDLEEVCRFQPALSCVKIELALKAAHDQVRANARQLRQVFLNLILNAADAFDSQADAAANRLRIETEVAEEAAAPSRAWLVVRFIDNGAGIPEEYLENIFDPFFTTKDPGRGTGLGLSVSFAIIEGIGGAIKAEPNPAHGTSVIIRLPLVKSETLP
jgi:C4-dicarboxylate-specific signal transduction histidine kinase